MADRRGANKRATLVDTAMSLVYAQGYSQTTLADIAEASGVPLGNVYYYFKTKDAICDAVIDALAERGAGLRAGWDALPDPVDRVLAYVGMTVDTGDAVVRNGCPIGSLCTELHKDVGPLADAARRLLADLLGWLETQLRLIGAGDDAPDLAARVLGGVQGACVLAHTLRDRRFLDAEAARIEGLVRGLARGEPSPQLR